MTSIMLDLQCDRQLAYAVCLAYTTGAEFDKLTLDMLQARRKSLLNASNVLVIEPCYNMEQTSYKIAKVLTIGGYKRPKFVWQRAKRAAHRIDNSL